MSVLEQAYEETARPRPADDNALERLRPPTSPAAMIRTLHAHRDLIWQMAKREVVGRYKGSILGLFWSFFYPLLMLAVYTFAFCYVFKASPRGSVSNLPPTRADMIAFALYAFAGLILFTLFSEVVNRAPVCILQNATYVKKVVFPLEILPFVYMLAALIHAGMSTLVLASAMLVFQGSLHWTLLLAPLVVIPLLLFILGSAWLLASLGVFLRDVAHAIGVVTMIMMYLSPVFYPVSMLHSHTLEVLIRFNPLTVPMDAFRALALDGTMPDMAWLGGYTVVACVVAWGGFFFFQRTKRGFADVL